MTDNLFQGHDIRIYDPPKTGGSSSPFYLLFPSQFSSLFSLFLSFPSFPPPPFPFPSHPLLPPSFPSP